MKPLFRFACMAAALPAIAAAQDPQATMSRVEVRQHYLPLTSACPGELKDLQENLYPAWRAIDSAAEVLVDFKLENGKVRDVKVSGGHGDYYRFPVRSAVHAMKCINPGQGTYAVRFSIKFVYPEDQGSTPTAMRISDEAPAMASL